MASQAVRKLYEHLKAAKEADVGRSLPVAAAAPALAPHALSLDDELDEAAQVRLKSTGLHMSPFA